MEVRVVQRDHAVDLDGLRGVAALSVGLAHAGIWTDFRPLPSAYLAVDFFLMLSGFVLSLAYGDKLRRGWAFRDYAVARAARLYPMIILGAALGVVATLLGERPDMQALRGFDLACAFPAAAAGIPIQLDGGIEPFPINVPEWSLFFELIASAAFGAALFKVRRRSLVWICLALLVPYVIMSHARGANVGVVWESFPLGFVRLSLPFAIGVLLHRVHRARMVRVPPAPLWLSSTMLLATFAVPRFAHLSWAVLICLVVAVYPLIVLSAATGRPGPVSDRLAGIGGGLSYPFYMIHIPVFTLILPGMLRAGIQPWEASVIAVALTAPVALVIHRRLDSPLQRAFRPFHRPMWAN